MGNYKRTRSLYALLVASACTTTLLASAHPLIASADEGSYAMSAWNSLAQQNGGKITKWEDRYVTSYWPRIYADRYQRDFPGKKVSTQELVNNMVLVEQLTEEDNSRRQKWRITFNRGIIDYRSGNVFQEASTSTPYFTILHSRDMRIVGDVKVTMSNPEGDANTTYTTTISPYLNNKDHKIIELDDDPQYDIQGRKRSKLRAPQALTTMPTLHNGSPLATLRDRLNGGDPTFKNQIEMDHWEYNTTKDTVHTNPNRGQNPDFGQPSIFADDLGAIWNFELDNKWEGRTTTDVVSFEFETQRYLLPLFPNATNHRTFVGGHFKSYDHSTLFLGTHYKAVWITDKDSDADGLSDRYEVGIQSDPYNRDTDKDGTNDGAEITDKNPQDLLINYKITGTDPTVGKIPAPKVKPLGVKNERIDGKAIPYSVVALYPKGSNTPIAETMADASGDYRLEMGKVFKRLEQNHVNKYGNTIALVNQGYGDNNVPNPEYQEITVNTEDLKGKELEIQVWSDGFDLRPLFTKPTVSEKFTAARNHADRWKDTDGNVLMALNPRYEATDPTALEPLEIGQAQSAFRDQYPDAGISNVVVNKNGSATITFIDRSSLEVPQKNVTQKKQPKLHESRTSFALNAWLKEWGAYRKQIYSRTSLYDGDKWFTSKQFVADGAKLEIFGNVRSESNTTLGGYPFTVQFEDGTYLWASSNNKGRLIFSEHKTADQTLIEVDRFDQSIRFTAKLDPTKADSPVTKDIDNTTSAEDRKSKSYTVKIYRGHLDPSVASAKTALQQEMHYWVIKDPAKVGVPVVDGSKPSSAQITDGTRIASGLEEHAHVITVALFDHYGDPVENAEDKIKVTQTSGQNVVIGTPKATGTSGEYEVKITTDKIDTAKLSVDFVDAASNRNVSIAAELPAQFIAGPYSAEHTQFIVLDSSRRLLNDNDQITAGQTVSVFYQPRDAYGHSLTGEDRKLRIQTNTIDEQVNEEYDLTFNRNAYQSSPIQLTLAGQTGLSVFTSSASSQAKNIVVVPADPNSAVIDLAQGKDSATVGTPLTDPGSFRVVDQYGNSMLKDTVVYVKVPGATGLSPVTLTADKDGRVSGTIPNFTSTSSADNAIKIYKANSETDDNLLGSKTISISNPHISNGDTTLTTNPQSPVEKTEVTVESVIKNNEGQPLANKDVLVVVPGSSSPIEASTNENGEVIRKDTKKKITYTASKYGQTDTIAIYHTAVNEGNKIKSLEVVPQKNPALEGKPSFSDADQARKSTAQIDEGPKTANGVDAYTVSVSLVDVYGEPVTGAETKLSLKPKDANAQLPGGLEVSSFTYDAGSKTYKATVKSTKTVETLVANVHYSSDTSASTPIENDLSIIFNPGPAVVSKSTLEIKQTNGSDIPADGITAGENTKIIYTPKDANGNIAPLTETVTVKIPKPDGSTQEVTLAKQKDGTYVNTAQLTKAGDNSIETKIGSEDGAQGSVKVKPGVPASALIANHATQATEGVLVSSQGTVTVKDAYGNTVADKTKVKIQLPGASAPVELTLDASGQAAIPEFTPDTPGQASITVTSADTPAKTLGSAQLTVAPSPLNADNSSITLDPVRPQDQKTVKVLVTIKNDLDNPVPGGEYLVVLPDGTEIIATANDQGQLERKTEKDGSKELSFIAADPDDGLQEIKVYKGSTKPADEDPFLSTSFTSEKNPDLEAKPVTTGKHAATAVIDQGPKAGDGTEHYTITVVLKDKYGQPVRNYQNNLTTDKSVASSNAGTLTTSDFTVGPFTESSTPGTYEAQVSATKVGTGVIDVKLDGTKIGQSLNAEFIAGAHDANHSDFEIKKGGQAVTGDGVTAGDRIDLVYTPKDAQGNLITSGLGDTIDVVVPTHDGSGSKTVKLTKQSDGTYTGSVELTKAGPNITLTPSVNGTNGKTAQIKVNSAAPHSATVTIDPAKQNATSGTQVTNPGTIKVVDEYGNDVAPKTQVYVKVPGQENLVPVTLEQGDSGVSGNIPNFTPGLSTDNAIVVYKQNQADDDNELGRTTVSVNNPHISNNDSTLAANPSDPVEKTSVTVEAVIKNNEGQVLEGKDVLLVVPGSPSGIEATTNSNGEVVRKSDSQKISYTASKYGTTDTVALYHTSIEENNLIKKIQVVPQKNSSLVGVPSFTESNDAQKSTASIDGGPKIANGSDAYTVKVKLVDAYGDPVLNAGSKLVIKQANGSELPQGVQAASFSYDEASKSYQASLSSTKAPLNLSLKAYYVADSSSNTAIDGDLSAAFNPDVAQATSSSLEIKQTNDTAIPTEGITAGENVKIVYTPKDANGNIAPLAETVKALIPQPDGGTQEVTLTKQNDGTYTGTTQLTKAGQNSIQSKVGEADGAQGSVKVNPGLPDTATIQGNATNATEGVLSPAQGTVTVKDAYGNTVADKTKVKIQLPGAQTTQELTLDGQGQASIPAFTPDTPGTQKITLTTSDAQSPKTLAETTVNVAPSPVSKTNSTIALSPTAPVDAQPVQVVVTIKNDLGNPVSGGDYLVELPDGTLVEATPGTNGILERKTATDDGSKTISFTAPAPEAGHKTVNVYQGTTKPQDGSEPFLTTSFTSRKNPDLENQPVFSGTHAATATITDGPKIADGTESYTITVVLKDKYGQAVTGAESKLNSTKSVSLKTGETLSTDTLTVSNFTPVQGTAGSYQATVSATKVGTGLIEVKYDQTKIGNSLSAAFIAGAPVAEQSSFEIKTQDDQAIPGAGVTAGTTVNLKYTPKDAQGNITSSGLGDTITVSVPSHEQGGSTTVTLTKQSDGSYTGTAQLTKAGDPISLTPQLASGTAKTGTVKVVPAEPHSATITIPEPKKTAHVGTEQTEAGSFVVVDQFGNEVDPSTTVYVKVPGKADLVPVTLEQTDSGLIGKIPNYNPSLSTDKSIVIYKENDAQDANKLGSADVTVVNDLINKEQSSLTAQPNNPVEKTRVVVTGAVKNSEAVPLVGKNLLVVTPDQPGGILATTDGQGAIVKRDDKSSISFTAGAQGVEQKIYLYEGDSVDASKLLKEASFTPIKNPSLTGQPSFSDEDGAHKSSAEITNAPGKVANNTDTQTITVTLVDAYGEPVAAKAASLSVVEASADSLPQGVSVTHFVEDQQKPGVYTASVTSTKAANFTLAARYSSSEGTSGGSADASPQVTVISQSLSTAFIAGPAHSATITMAQGKESILAGQPITNPGSFVVVDEYDNPVAATTVYVKVPGQSALQPVAITTSPDGSQTVGQIPDFTAATSADNTISVYKTNAEAPENLIGSKQLTVTNEIYSEENSSLSVSPASPVEGAQVTVNASLKNTENAGIPNKEVLIVTPDAPEGILGITQADGSVLTKDGSQAITYTAGKQGIAQTIEMYEGNAKTPEKKRKTLQVTPIKNPSEQGKPSFTDANGAHASTVSIDEGPKTADGLEHYTVTIKLVDIYGDAVTGKTAELSLIDKAASDSAPSKLQFGSVQEGSGKDAGTYTISVSTETAGTYKLEARYDESATAGTGGSPIVATIGSELTAIFKAGALDLSKSGLELKDGQGQNLPEEGISAGTPVKIIFTPKDAKGNPVELEEGQKLTLTIPQNGDPASTTVEISKQPDGSYSVTTPLTKAGESVEITSQMGDKPGPSVSSKVVPATLHSARIEGAASTATAGVEEPAAGKIIAQDQYGNPVAANTSLYVSMPGDQSPRTLQTNAQGEVMLPAFTTNTAGQQQITVKGQNSQEAPVLASHSVTVAASPLNTTNTQMSINPSAPVDGDSVELTVIMKNDLNETVSGGDYLVEMPDGSLIPATADENGQLIRKTPHEGSTKFTQVAPAPSAGEQTFKVYVGIEKTPAAFKHISYTSTENASEQNKPVTTGDKVSTASISTGTKKADGEEKHTITVVLYNKYGKAITGQQASIQATLSLAQGSTGELSADNLNTAVSITGFTEDANTPGTYTAELSSNKAGTVSVQVSAASVTIGDALSAAFIADAPSATESVFEVTLADGTQGGAQIPAEGITAGTGVNLKYIPKDAQGNNASASVGETITVSVPTHDGTGTKNVTLTKQSDGSYTGTTQLTKAGDSISLTPQVNNAAGKTASVKVNPATLNNVVIGLAEDAKTAEVNETKSNTGTITATDEYGNPVAPGTTVFVKVPGMQADAEPIELQLQEQNGKSQANLPNFTPASSTDNKISVHSAKPATDSNKLAEESIAVSNTAIDKTKVALGYSPDQPIESQTVTVVASIKNSENNPLAGKELTVVVPGSQTGIAAKSLDDGSVVDRQTEQPISFTAGEQGVEQFIYLYEGDSTDQEKLLKQVSFTPAKDSAQTGKPVFSTEKGALSSKARMAEKDDKTADGQAAHQIIVELVNKYGDPVSGLAGSLSARAISKTATGEITPLASEQTTGLVIAGFVESKDTPGTYTANVTSTVAYRYTLEALYTDKGAGAAAPVALSLEAPAPVAAADSSSQPISINSDLIANFVAGSIDQTQSVFKVTQADGTELPADGVPAGGMVKISYEPKDAQGNPIVLDEPIVVTVPGAPGQPAIELTLNKQQDGSYSNTTPLKTAGTNTISSKIGEAEGPSTSVTVLPGAPASASISGAASTATQGEETASTGEVTVLDQFGNPVVNKEVYIKLPGMQATDKPQPLMLDAQGKASIPAFTPDQTGEQAIVVYADKDGQTELTRTTVNVSNSPLSKENSSVELNPTKPVDGKPVEVTAIIKNKLGQPVSGGTYLVELPDGTTIEATADENGKLIKKTPDPDGNTKITFTSPEPGAGEQSVKVHLGDAVTEDPFLSTSFTPAKDPALEGKPVLTGEKPSVAQITTGNKKANGEEFHEITVKLYDKYGEPIKGAAAKISASPAADLTISAFEPVEGKPGEYKAKLSALVAKNYETSVSYESTKIADKLSANFVADSFDPSKSEIEITAGGKKVNKGDHITAGTEIEVVFTPKDSKGNPTTLEPGQKLVIVVPGIKDPIELTAKGDGTYSTTITPELAGEGTITSGIGTTDAPGAQDGPSFNLVVDPANPSAADFGEVVNRGQAGEPITNPGSIIIKDEFGNPVANTPVYITIPGSTGPVPVTTDDQGKAQIPAFTPDSPGKAIISVSTNPSGQPVLGSTEIQVDPANVSNTQSSLNTNPETPVDSQSVTVVAKVKDKNGAPLAGRDLVVELPNGTQIAATSTADGSVVAKDSAQPISYTAGKAGSQEQIKLFECQSVPATAAGDKPAAPAEGENSAAVENSAAADKPAAPAENGTAGEKPAESTAPAASAAPANEICVLNPVPIATKSYVVAQDPALIGKPSLEKSQVSITEGKKKADGQEAHKVTVSLNDAYGTAISQKAADLSLEELASDKKLTISAFREIKPGVYEASIVSTETGDFQLQTKLGAQNLGSKLSASFKAADHANKGYSPDNSGITITTPDGQVISDGTGNSAGSGPGTTEPGKPIIIVFTPKNDKGEPAELPEDATVGLIINGKPVDVNLSRQPDGTYTGSFTPEGEGDTTVGIIVNGGAGPSVVITVAKPKPDGGSDNGNTGGDKPGASDTPGSGSGADAGAVDNSGNTGNIAGSLSGATAADDAAAHKLQERVQKRIPKTSDARAERGALAGLYASLAAMSFALAYRLGFARKEDEQDKEN